MGMHAFNAKIVFYLMLLIWWKKLSSLLSATGGLNNFFLLFYYPTIDRFGPCWLEGPMLKFLFISCQITGFGSSKRSSTPRSSRPFLLCRSQCSGVPSDVDDDDKEAFCVVIENEIGNHLSHSQVPSKEFWIITLLYWNGRSVDKVRPTSHYSILS